MTIAMRAGIFLTVLVNIALSGVRALVLDTENRHMSLSRPAPSSDWERRLRKWRKSNTCTVNPEKKIITWIRHAEGRHNVDPLYAATVKDAELSPKGKTQAASLGSDPRLQGKLAPELVVSSPMRRTMATALGAFGNLSVPWHLEPRIQETPACVVVGGLCNIGDPVAATELLKQEGRQDLLELYTALPQGWNVHEGNFTPDVAHLHERFQRFTSWLLARPEQRIAVVSHGDFTYANLGVLLNNAAVLALTLSPKGVWRKATEVCTQRGVMPVSDPPLATADQILAQQGRMCPAEHGDPPYLSPNLLH